MTLTPEQANFLACFQGDLSLEGLSRARILEMIESLDELWASAEFEIFREVEQDESVIDRIAAAQREELELEIGKLKAEAESIAEEAKELVGEVPF